MAQYRTTMAGFTLLELLAVISIMALIVTIAMPVYQDYSDRARSTELIGRYDAMRTNTATALRAGRMQNCDDLANSIDASNLGQDYADLSLGFEAVGSNGYRPVLAVCARNDAQGAAAVRVAHAALDELSNQHRVEAGAVVSDAVVSFALPLTLDNQPACTVAVTTTSNTCGASPPQPSLASTPPTAQPAAQAPVQTAAAEPVVFDQTNPPATPEAATAASEQAMASLSVTEQQEAAAITAQMAQDPELAAAVAQAMANGTTIAGVPGPNASLTDNCPNAVQAKFLGADMFLGNCAVDFEGMCDECFVQEYCAVYCGISRPTAAGLIEAIKVQHYATMMVRCRGERNAGRGDSGPACQEFITLTPTRY